MKRFYIYKNKDNGLFYNGNDGYTSRIIDAVFDNTSKFSSKEDALLKGSLSLDAADDHSNVEVLEVLELENQYTIIDELPAKTKEDLLRLYKEVNKLEDRIYDLTCDMENLLRKK